MEFSEDKIIIESLVQVPADEAWLFEPQNKEILASVKKGLKQKGTIERGSFSNFLKE